MKTNIKTEKRVRLHKKIRSKISGTADTPRLAVFRSNRYMYAQLIDDVKGVTLVSASDIGQTDAMTKIKRAEAVGKKLADAAKKISITTVVFDRGGFSYRGRVQALADAARAAGLVF
jgi:large subunit ribosomal protein L18